MLSDEVIYTVADRVASITLNRPEVRNAISPEVIGEIIRLVRLADQDPQVKCLLIRGTGEHFCGGGDVKTFSEPLSLPAEERFDIFERRLFIGNRLPKALLDCSKPIVIATRGAVAGAGLALCLAADFVLCGESSYFLAAHVLIGLSLDCGLSGLLIPAMGIKAAKRLALLGEKINAEEALAVGIVTKVIPDAFLDEEVESLIGRLAAGPGTAMAGTKKLLNDVAYPNFTECLSGEASAVANCAASTDFPRGVEGMLTRRTPVFD
ncbi:enoyl-CoA hydratase/isomerase family protein [Ferribacterium limneticum]|uniref:enoyl-CoA hydratase/isomerase family protein n=1 Tax=Ferribacterium limneticum TaxID=76259 RepID=UPI001CF8761D|nr:enoyl-CoA hydratase-related protein [Ferribacterium limneticum]UCV23636.1 enoyl-CoA hydratase/isomerase family protein [Ferribacterium limneticum]